MHYTLKDFLENLSVRSDLYPPKKKHLKINKNFTAFAGAGRQDPQRGLRHRPPACRADLRRRQHYPRETPFHAPLRDRHRKRRDEKNALSDRRNGIVCYLCHQ